MAGRTTSKWTSVYLDYWHLAAKGIISAGPLAVEAEMGDHATFGDAITGGLPVSMNITPGTINYVLEFGVNSYMSPTASPNAPGTHLLTFAIGDRAAAAQGDPVFCCYGEQLSSASDIGAGMVTMNQVFGPYNVAQIHAYTKAWGKLLHAFSSTDAVNSSAGVDGLAATTAGGYMVYHVYAGTGTVTIKVQDSANNSDWLDLSGATTGVITQTNAYGIVSIGTTATVRQYLRWQVVFGTASACEFALSFIRG